MEKLLRDLNIYAHSFMNCNLTFTYDGNRIRVQGDEIGPYVAESIILNKKFGFIQRLVENDKIDFDKCGLDIKDYLSYNKRYDKGIVMAENYDNDTFVVREFYSPYEQLLMLLSISNSPIEDLISYLK